MESAIEHMNSDHQDAVIAILKHFSLVESKDAIIKEINEDYMIIRANEEDFKVNFPEKVGKDNIKNVLVSMTRTAKSSLNQELNKHLLTEVNDFISNFKTVVISSLYPNNKPCVTYAPFIRYNNKNYIYISSIAEHYENIIQNSNAIEVLFLEDESKCKQLLARARVRFKAEAKKINRNSDIFEGIMDKFQNNLGSTMQMVRQMTDFDLFELSFKDGRYVKGFGKAYLLEDNENGIVVYHLKGDKKGNSHNFPKSTLNKS